MRAPVLTIALAAFATGCSPSPKAATAAPPAPKPVAAPGAPPAAAALPAAVPAAADPKKDSEPEWAYSSVGKRDPFRSFLSEIQASTAVLATRCATPLGRFEIEQLKLVAVVTGLEDPVAMVEAPNGVGYAVHRGACIGKNGGTVAAVRSGEVIVSEWAIRADGTRDKTKTVLRLPKQAQMNLEE
jgi:type IV pilus assembly protein PilP